MTSFDENGYFETNQEQEFRPSKHSKVKKPVIKAGRRHDDPENRTMRNPFFIPFCLILAFALVELFTGVWSQSLALLSDAWHMFSDVFSIGLAMLAYRVTQQAQTKFKKNGHTSKAELMASIINAVLMFVVIGWIVHEAWQRFSAPPPVQSAAVIFVAFIGLLVNIYVAKYLHQDHDHDHDEHEHSHQLNHQAAFLHVIGDLLGSVAALISGVVIYVSDWVIVDPILSLLIAGLLLLGTLNLSRNIVKTLRHQH